MRKYVSRFHTVFGAPVTMELWNPNIADLAHHFSVTEDEVDIAENEDGEEVVTVKGESVGLLERF
jgi:hypothetical protein